MALRPIDFSIPSTTELKVKFSDSLSDSISIENFEVQSLSGGADDLEVLAVTITDNIALIKTRPQVTGNYYSLKFLDTANILFTSIKGHELVNDAVSRELFFTGIDTINPIRDNMLSLFPKLIDIENTTVRDITSAQAEEIYIAQKSIGEVLSNNYISVDVIDEPRTRTAGATDRLAHENAFSVERVSPKRSGISPKLRSLDYTLTNDFERLQAVPAYPISLQQTLVTDEIIALGTEGNSFDGFLLKLKNTKILKLLSLKLIKESDVEDCDGNIGTEYNIGNYKYSIADNKYDQDYAFKFQQLESNEILLSEFGNLEQPVITDTIILSYLYKDTGIFIAEDSVVVSRVEEEVNESVPTNSTRFYLGNAPIVTTDNDIPSIGGVTFSTSENNDATPSEFRHELVYNVGRLPSRIGEYSINYQTGEVFLVGATKLGEGTGRNSYIVNYHYRREFKHNLDYSLVDNDLVATPDRALSNDEAEISFLYDTIYVDGVDYRNLCHIEVMGEQVENRLSQSFSIKTKHSPVTNVFRILNQTTGEIYTPIYNNSNEIHFAGRRSPEVKTITSENAAFDRVQNEDLVVIGEFIAPIFETTITSNISNNSIQFEPGIPAELISYNSNDYFIRQPDGDDIEDIQIRLFGDSDSNNLISSLGISTSASPPSIGSEIIIGPRTFVINLDQINILNNNLDAIGSIINTSLYFSNQDIFVEEKFFSPLTINPGFTESDSGTFALILAADKNDEFYVNLSRLRKVGDYAVDYNNGIVYVAVEDTQDISEVGSVSYNFGRHTTKYPNVLSVSSITKKINSPDAYNEAIVNYEDFSNTSSTINLLDLENTNIVWDGESKAFDSDGVSQFICEVLEDYTIVVPYDIVTINVINRLSDLTGSNLTSYNQDNRVAEYSSSDLVTSVKNNGRNIYDISNITFSENIIDLKKTVRRRVYENSDGDLSVTINDATAESLADVTLVRLDSILFDQNLNITKVDAISISNIEDQSGNIIASLFTESSLDDVDIVGDYLLDSDGNRFKILEIDTFLSIATVECPAENNSSVLTPVTDSIFASSIIVKPTVTISGGSLTIAIPSDVSVITGDLLEIRYLTTLTPAIGTALSIDYRYGSLFFDYSYVVDDIAVWYEYGDNTLDWSISDTLSEGDEYYVTYKYGALRDALRVNFGNLTNIPFFKTFPLNVDRELYRDAISGTLQSFSKGPTIPAYTQLIKSFTDINPKINELSFGTWILGRDYLSPSNVSYDGNLSFGEGKFDGGLLFNDGVTVSVPAISNISVNEGTLEAWVRPNWSGVANDATLTFDIENIGVEKIYLNQNDDPFSFENNWVLIPVESLIGSTDGTGPGLIIYNFESDSDQDLGISQGSYGIYKNIDALNKTIKLHTDVKLKILEFGTSYNSLRESAPSGRKDEYSVGAITISDGYCFTGMNLILSQLSGFDYNSSTTITELPDFSGPYRTRSCTCTIDNDIETLEQFGALTIEIDLSSDYVTGDLLESYEFIDAIPSSFIIVDENERFYEIVSFVDNNGVSVSNSIPALISKILVKQFSLNSFDSQKSADEINLIVPTGSLKLYVKQVDFYTNTTYSNSIDALDFKKVMVLDWSVYHNYKISANPLANEVIYYIDNEIENILFYTDAARVSQLPWDLSSDNADFIGIGIGIFDEDISSSLELNYSRSTLYHRFTLDDIFIGRDAYSPKRMPFSINKEDFPKIAIGLPNASDSSEGIFIGFDELCTSPISREVGQWVFRTRAAREITIPIDVDVTDDGYTQVYGVTVLDHTFIGEITTDGEFSSVVRASRDEDGTCNDGIDYSASFRYCGNGLLESGWTKLDESDSDLINVIIGGRETEKVVWRKHGQFNTSVSSGIYRIGPIANSFDCIDEEQALGNLVYTQTPCLGGDFEYLISLKVAQVSEVLSSSNIGAFTGTTSGNHTGIVPIHINDEEINAKISLAFSDIDEPLVLIMDAENNAILDTVFYSWNDQSFHEYKLIKNSDDGLVQLYIDDLLLSQTLITEYSEVLSDVFEKESIAIYAFDSSLADIENFLAEHIPSILDIDLILYSASNESTISQLDDNDIFISTDSRIEFEFTIDENDLVVDGYLDAYDGYSSTGVDEMLITSDKKRYLMDSAIGEANQRMSIFKDGKGFLNFRVYSDGLEKNNEAGLFNIATNIKSFKAGELHHIAASWKLNTLNEQDELHLFIDGFEAPNIYKFGGKIPVKLNDKFSDVSKEVLQSFLVSDIQYCDIYSDGQVSASDSVFVSNLASFDQNMIGRTIIITESDIATTLVNQAYVIKSVVDSTQVTLGKIDTLATVEFDVTASNIGFKFAPIAGITNSVLTDVRNSKFAIFKTDASGNQTEMSGIQYTVSNGIITIENGTNVESPKFRTNLDTRIIEFIQKNSDCEYESSVNNTDVDIHIETFGLNLARFRKSIQLASSSYNLDSDLHSGLSILKTHGVEPASLDDVEITRIIYPKTQININSPVLNSEDVYIDTFDIEIDTSTGYHKVSSASGQIEKQNLGRKLRVYFDSDNINYCEYDGYIAGELSDGYGDAEIVNTIVIYGETTDGTQEETFILSKNGYVDGEKFFTSIATIAGRVAVIDVDNIELGVLEIKEVDLISEENNGGDSAEIYEYRNGTFILSTYGSSGEFPFELHPGYYDIEYPAFLNINIPQIGDKLFIGTDYLGNNNFNGIVDEFRIISEMSSDTRTTEIETSGTRSITDDFNRSTPFCSDSQTLSLISFDNPINVQRRKLRNIEFLNSESNFKYKLSSSQLESLLESINDSASFISKMINMGFSDEAAYRTYYESHLAENGPIKNDADVYKNVIEYAPSNSSVNSQFDYSAVFKTGRSLLLKNNNGIFRKDEGTIEFWVSPILDTKEDPNRKYYVDIYSSKRQRVTSTSSRSITLPNSAREVIDVRLLDQTQEFSDLYSSDEIDRILFDEISRSSITGKLAGGTGVKKNFGVGNKLSADGSKILLAESLPSELTDVVVTYIPLDSSGDRISIFKNEYNQIVFAITANGIDNMVTAEIEWKKNTWHRVLCTYRTNSSFDTMRIFTDGVEGGLIRYGTGLIYGTGFVYGQYIQGDGQARNVDYSIPLTDEFRLISIGSDIFGDNSAYGRLDNIRFSRIIRPLNRDASGAYIDENYSSNVNTVSPVVSDDVTTLLLDFDEEQAKIEKFATIIDPKNGIFDFEIEVIDNFDKVIGINDGQVEDLIKDLVKRLKPAHSNALVKFTKSKC